MHRTIRAFVVLAAGAAALIPPTVGHGGNYRGLTSPVPPIARDGASASPGPARPVPPSWTRDTLVCGRIGQDPGNADLVLWDYWWEFNRAPYLDLKSSVYHGDLIPLEDIVLDVDAQRPRDTLRPSGALVRHKVVPALVNVLERERAPDPLSGALVALAKIGEVQGESTLHELVSEFLGHPNQEVSETAAVALGILGEDRAVPVLVGLLEDTPRARELVRRIEVPVRTRAFAGYALGLIGNRPGDGAVRQKIVRHLIGILESPHFSRRDVKVAAMTALGLTPLDVVDSADDGGDSSQVASRRAQLRFLLDYLDETNRKENRSRRHWFVRTHAPTAIARLLEGTGADFDWARWELMAQASGDAAESPHVRDQLRWGSLLALGQVGGASDSGLDEAIRAELVRLLRSGDLQSRRLALIALAQVGGRPGRGPTPFAGTAAIRGELLRQLSKGKTTMKPWAALALGVLGRQLLDNDAQIDTTAALALRSATAENRRPSDIGAYLVGLGIRRDTEAKDIALEKLADFQGSDVARGYAAIALGLMQDRSAIEPIRSLIGSSLDKPELLMRAVLGLTLLGDKQVGSDLTDMLGEAEDPARQVAITAALSMVGDVRTIDPLLDLMQNTEATATVRGLAAAGLGIVCDRAALPWSARIANHFNYRASTVTLTGGGNGILDLF
ncbi:MAG: hypothetical protein GY711_34170 [bacterium]|nr:hypothetical protein [bacterium]